ncbi:unnamed protein product, partial [Meganyctiphanes norvegica]
IMLYMNYDRCQSFQDERYDGDIKESTISPLPPQFCIGHQDSIPSFTGYIADMNINSEEYYLRFPLTKDQWQVNGIVYFQEIDTSEIIYSRSLIWIKQKGKFEEHNQICESLGCMLLPW